MTHITSGPPVLTDGYLPQKINSKIQFLVYNITKLISNFERVCSKRFSIVSKDLAFCNLPVPALLKTKTNGVKLENQDHSF